MPTVTVVVPAYRPGDALVHLVEELVAVRPTVRVLVVDDGSGPCFDLLFEASRSAGAELLRLPRNGGKGRALKSGFSHLHERGGTDVVVCADADGQHAVADILAVADAVDDAAPPHLVLGVRGFATSVPLRSRIGNDATRLLFQLSTGVHLADTQTGLRAFPAALLPWLAGVAGERYEYELTMLLQAVRQGVVLRTVPIRTIYLDDNSSSHFRPVADSVRIYRPLLLFLAASLSSFLIDAVALLTFQAATGSLALSVVGARLLSATVNFALNRRLVFDRDRTTSTRRSVGRYAALAVTVLALNYLLLYALVGLGAPLLAAKVATEISLVALSYGAQSRSVFRQASRAPGALSGHRDPSAEAKPVA